MVSELEYQIIVSEFDSHWLSHTYGVVSQLSKTLKIPVLIISRHKFIRYKVFLYFKKIFSMIIYCFFFFIIWMRDCIFLLLCQCSLSPRCVFKHSQNGDWSNLSELSFPLVHWSDCIWKRSFKDTIYLRQGSYQQFVTTLINPASRWLQWPFFCKFNQKNTLIPKLISSDFQRKISFLVIRVCKFVLCHHCFRYSYLR